MYLLKDGDLEQVRMHLGPASHHGIPRASSRLAFDPGQRLLAIGTLDGKVKLIGNNGVEGILVTASQSRCKYLEFANNQGFLVHVTSENDLQIWDLEKRELTETHRWNTNVTAFAMMQGSPFMYIGEDSGDVAVLEYDREQKMLRQMPYCIPIQAARGNISKLINCSAYVTDILPYPDTVHSRVLIVYSDGIIVVWSLFDSHIKKTRKVSGKRLIGLDSDDDNVYNEKDICCICWADSSGNILAVGYTDGDIWLWDLALSSNKSSGESDVPLVKLQLSADRLRSPVLALRWCAGGGREAAASIGGHLFVFGGRGLGCSEAFTVCSLKTATGQSDVPNVHHVDIPLEGLLEDMILLPGPGATFFDQAAALLVLTSQGQLRAYDEASITKCLEQKEKSFLPEPVPINPFTTESSITVTMLVEVPEDGKAANILSQLPRHIRGNLPSVLPGGTKWPVTGGFINKYPEQGSKVSAILVTGHADGSVHVWDVSTSVFLLLCDLLPTQSTSRLVVSHMDFCSSQGILLVARGSSVVSVYKLSAEAGDVRCIFCQASEIQDQQLHQDAGFQCRAILNTGIAVGSISISSDYEHVAVGHADGTVSVLDIDCCTLMVERKVVFSNERKHIRFLTFGSGVNMSAPSDSSFRLASSLKVIYVAEDSSFSALLYSSEAVFTCGPWHVDDYRVLYIRCLEIFNEQKGEEKIGPPASEKLLDKGKSPKQTDFCSHHLLVCTQGSACLYRSLVSNQGASLTSLKTARIQPPCSSASAFFCQTINAHILILLNNSTLEVRSLPGFEVIQQFCMDGIYNLDPKVSENPRLLCGDRGLMALVNVRREIVMFSVLSGDENLRTEDQAVSFFDKEVAAASEAALKAGSVPQRRKSQFQGLIGGVLKEIKGGLLKSPKGEKELSMMEIQEPDYLFKIFMSPFGNPQLEKTSLAAGLAPKLDIDDIQVEDEIIKPGTSENVPKRPKGKEKVLDHTDNRQQLFDGDEDYSKPARRSIAEIKAKYGYKPLGDVSGAAGLARDKLLERQEKLQALGNRTAELQNEAENFASLAEELVKTMEGRKWWQL